MSIGTWAKENPLLAIVAIVFGAGVAITGIVFGFVLLVVLAAEAPAALFVFLFLVVFFGGFAALSRLSSDETDESDEIDATDEPDPLTDLERRYVRGEIDEDEFEHRLGTVLDADQRAGRDTEFDPDRTFEFETER